MSDVSSFIGCNRRVPGSKARRSFKLSDDNVDIYVLDGRDRALLAAAGTLLGNLVSAGRLRPAEMISVAKLQHVLSRLPKPTSGLEVTVSFISPRRHFDEIETYHWWDIEVHDEELSIKSGGYFFRPGTGGDTFTTMTWGAAPGEPSAFADYREHLGIVPDVQSFQGAVAGIDFRSGQFKVEVRDSDNPLLDDPGRGGNSGFHRVAGAQHAAMLAEDAARVATVQPGWASMISRLSRRLECWRRGACRPASLRSL